MVSSLQEKVASRVALINAKVDLEETSANVFAEVLIYIFRMNTHILFSVKMIAGSVSKDTQVR